MAELSKLVGPAIKLQSVEGWDAKVGDSFTITVRERGWRALLRRLGLRKRPQPVQRYVVIAGASSR